MCAINHVLRGPSPRPTPKCRCTNAPPLLSVGMGTCSISPPLGGGRPTPTAGPPVLSSFFGPMVRAWPPPLLLGCRFGGAMPSRVSPNRGRRHVTSTGAGVFFLFFFATRCPSYGHVRFASRYNVTSQYLFRQPKAEGRDAFAT